MVTERPGPAEIYTRPAAMTAAGRHRAALEALPGEISEVATVVQGLLLHE